MIPLLVASLALLPAAAAPTAFQTQGTVFGSSYTIEVVGIDRDGMEAVVTETRATASRLESDARAIAAVRGGSGAVALSDGAFRLLERAQAYCVWSEGAVSALGGPLFRLWGLTQRAAGLPSAEAIDEAAIAGRCDRLALDPAGPSATLAAGSEIHLFPLAQGWAADSLLDAAVAAGAKNARIRLGIVQKGIGAGPEGSGWLVVPPTVPGAEIPAGGFWLRDRAVAILSPGDRTLEIGGERHPAYLDLAGGRPSDGVAQVIVVAERALDAQAIGYAMFGLGPRKGQFRIGGLDPSPAVYWLLGRGEGPPLMTESNWWTVPKQ